MKKILILFAAFMFLFSFNETEARGRGARVSFDFFYTNLEPYGEWIQYDGGLIVWRPAMVHRDWQPYSVGRWTWTDYGWYWDSYEPFGWATYHYGRWHYDNYYGWVWIPDYEWGPAWVEWRYNDNYIGWAPLSPYAEFSISFGIRFSRHYDLPYHHWRFVRYNHFCNNNVNYYIINDNRTIYRIHDRSIHNTRYRYRDNRIYNEGVSRNIIEKRTRSRIHKSRVVRSNDRNFKSREKSKRNYVTRYTPTERELRSAKKDRIKLKRSRRKSSLELNDRLVKKQRFNDRIKRESRELNKKDYKRKSKLNRKPDLRNYKSYRKDSNDDKKTYRKKSYNRKPKYSRDKSYNKKKSYTRKKNYSKKKTYSRSKDYSKKKTYKRKSNSRKSKSYNKSKSRVKKKSYNRSNNKIKDEKKSKRKVRRR